jgi:transposase
VRGVLLGVKEQLKLEFICKVVDGRMSPLEAQKLLNISERTLRRYLASYRKIGICFVKHGNHRRAPKNKTPELIKLKIQSLIQEKYFDFNVCHIQEKIFQEIEIKIKYETLRKWCQEINLVKKAKRRRAKPRYRRERFTQEGLFLQMDGSHHCWFGDRFLCLLAIIDDATSEVYARFYEGETSLACLDFLQRFILKKGMFKVLYTDRAGVYGGIKREHFSQVERALGEVGTQVIYAQSPESKGRVERLFGTLQDRLVAELRLLEIKTIEAANEYLEKTYLPGFHNPKFRVLPQNPISGYRSLPLGINLEQVFCLREYRVVGRDHTVSIQANRWMVTDPLKQSIAGQKIELRYDLYGQWVPYFANKPIKLVPIKIVKKNAA